MRRKNTRRIERERERERDIKMKFHVLYGFPYVPHRSLILETSESDVTHHTSRENVATGYRALLLLAIVLYTSWEHQRMMSTCPDTSGDNMSTDVSEIPTIDQDIKTTIH